MTHWATDTEIECTDCDGHGEVMRKDGMFGFQYIDGCTACNGAGYRAPTADELDNMAEDAYSRQFEGEPPLSQRERDEWEANARLINEAPELIALAFQYRDDLRHPPTGDSIQRRLEAIEAVIQKAIS